MEAAGKRYIVYGSRSNRFFIWNIADLHLFNAATEMKRIKRDIDRIKNDEFSFWVGGGDYADYISYDDKRFDLNSIPPDFKARDLKRLGTVQTEAVRNLFKPIAHKCLGLILGNHEEKYMKNKDQADLHSWLCTELGVPNLKYSAMFDIVFCRLPGTKAPKLYVNEPPPKIKDCYTRRFMIHHGFSGATTSGGKLNSLNKFIDTFEADIYMIGHVHDRIQSNPIKIGADRDCRNLEELPKLGLITGSYLRTYAQGVTSYGEVKGYKPVPLGATCAIITPDKEEMRAEI